MESDEVARDEDVAELSGFVAVAEVEIQRWNEVSYELPEGRAERVRNSPNEMAIVGHELVERFQRFLRALFLNESDCGRSGYVRYESCPTSANGSSQRKLTSNDDEDGSYDGRSVIVIAYKRANSCTAQQQHDQRFPELPRESFPQGIFGCDLEFIGTGEFTYGGYFVGVQSCGRRGG